MAVTEESIKALLSTSVLQQRLAKYLTLKCVRNSVLEDFHAGTVPATATGDYTDVTVHTPYGQIPWNQLSRISDEEMKLLMQDVVNHTYRFIQELFDEERGGELMLHLASHDPVPQWDDPQSL